MFLREDVPPFSALFISYLRTAKLKIAPSTNKAVVENVLCIYL